MLSSLLITTTLYKNTNFYIIKHKASLPQLKSIKINQFLLPKTILHLEKPSKLLLQNIDCTQEFRVKTITFWKAYFLERLNDFFHVNELAIVGLEWEVDIDAPDVVRRHFLTFCSTPRKSRIWGNTARAE
jgi:hypothetical protein